MIVMTMIVMTMIVMTMIVMTMIVMTMIVMTVIVMTMIVMTMIVMTMIVMTMIVMTMIVMTVIVMTVIVICFRCRFFLRRNRRMLSQVSLQIPTRCLQIPAAIDRDGAAFVEIQLPRCLLPSPASPLDSNHPPRCTDLLHFPGKLGTILDLPADPQRGAVAKNRLLDGRLLMETAEDCEQDALPSFLHCDRCGEQIQRPLMPNPLHQKRQILGGHIVDLCVADQDLSA
jgi:hypothetical protein